jgi:hypothetical protein
MREKGDKSEKGDMRKKGDKSGGKFHRGLRPR